jgi:hypothetical protein
MFEHWGEFYLLAGSAAAVLIGLIFVVVTLMQDRPRSTMLAGGKLYMGPVVLQVSFVLVLSAAALTPDISARDYAMITAAVAIWGLFRAVQSAIGITQLHWEEEPPHWTDKHFYGVLPTWLFLGLGLVAWGFWTEANWAVHGIAAAVTAILLLAIRNEWDLVTWLAPRGDAEESSNAG